jgi:hypothetical protein
MMLILMAPLVIGARVIGATVGTTGIALGLV